MHEGRRELVETPEFTSEFDEVVQRHSRQVIVPVLTGLLDGIASNPQQFDRTLGHTRLARSDSLGITIPTFTIVFQILDEGKDSEYIGGRKTQPAHGRDRLHPWLPLNPTTVTMHQGNQQTVKYASNITCLLGPVDI